MYYLITEPDNLITNNGPTLKIDAAGELCSISHANYNLEITPGIPGSPTGTCANISMVASLDTVRPDTEVCARAPKPSP